MMSFCRFSILKAKPNNLFVVSLSLSGLLMMSKVPVFVLNLHHGGPYAGRLGAQVQSSVLHSHWSRSNKARLSLVENLLVGSSLMA